MSKNKKSTLTVLSLLENNAERFPDAPAYIFLSTGDIDSAQEISYDALRRRAKQAAAHLMANWSRPGHVLLLLPPGIDYLVAFFACLYAGVPAVPAYPPSGRRDNQRIAAILGDSAAVAVFGNRATLERTRSLDPEADSKLWLDIGAIAHTAQKPWQAPVVTAETIAFIQYTSGSTGSPKGVMLTHGNLMHNLAQTYAHYRCTPKTRLVSWLPPYHDMGLIGGILQPLYCGTPGILMPPAAFIQRPYRWLHAISHFDGTMSPAPNFAYELCVKKITPEQRGTLDLSKWAVAINGAEPIRTETLDAFVQAFESCGFREASFFPSYGLAEASLLVCAAAGMQRIQVSKAALGEGRVVLAQDDEGERQAFVSHGLSIADQAVRIVDSRSFTACADDQVGEIWVSGPSVAKGYFGKREASQETFGAEIEGERGRTYLRTGDLGFIKDGQLYVTGRQKDLIIIHGQNLYPQDIEAVVEGAHPALRAHAGAAFAVQADGADAALAIVHELEFRSRIEPQEVIDAIRQAMADAVAVPIAAVVLVKAGSIPMTSSGKIQRRATHELYQRQALNVVAQWTNGNWASGDRIALPDDVPKLASVGSGRGQHITQWIVARMALELGVEAQAIDAQRPFSESGLDSVKIISMLGALSEWLDEPVDPTIAWEYATPSALGRFLAGEAAQPRALAARSKRALDRSAVAVVGIGCRVPGARTPDAFWELLKHGRTQEPGGGVSMNRLEDVDRFDAHFFGIAPREADAMDPQQRQLLEVSWEALENAGCPVDSLAGSDTGVFIGISGSDYALKAFDPRREANAYAATGNAHSIAANRMSYLYDLRGPSIAVDTACSSSLVAVHLACQSLRGGECGLAIVAGVNILLSEEVFDTFRAARMLSPDDRCKTFDASADGYARADGCLAIVLKPLSDAQADGDHVHAVIRGSAVNQDGRSNGLTAPNGQAQQAVIRAALEDAGVRGDAIGFVETHGTGTPLGDPIELHALQQALGDAAAMPCRIGALKAEIGHLEAAAGIAGLIKACMVLSHGEIPPHRRLSSLNPKITLGHRFSVPTEAVPWASGQPRYAGVSSFGFGGTNAHVVLESAPTASASLASAPAQRSGLHAYTVSAKSPQALSRALERHAQWQEAKQWPLAEACRASNVGRTHFQYRASVTAASHEELIAALQQARQAWDGRLAAEGHPERRPGGRPRVGFVYTGQGAQHAGMCVELYAQEPVFRQAFDECDAILQREHGLSVWRWLERGEAVDDTQRAQLALFVCEFALTRLWASWGVTPDCVMGHSLGEFAAACAAGCLSLETALALVVKRSALMGAVSAKGGMAALNVDEAAVARLLSDSKADVEIAALNGPGTVVSGDLRELDRLTEYAQKQGIGIQRLSVSNAFHSRLMDCVLDAFEDYASEFDYQPARVPLISNLTGGVLAPDELPDAKHWRRHLRQPVRFAEGVQAMADAGCEVFLEVGPHPTLLPMMRRILRADHVEIVASLRKNVPDGDALLAALCRLYDAGCAVDWVAVHGYRRGQLAPLPTYPFERTSHWLATVRDGVAAAGAADPLVARVHSRLEAQLRVDADRLHEETHEKQRLLDELSLGYMASAVAGWTHGLDAFDAADVIERSRAMPRFRRALRVWLDDLSKAQAISFDGQRYRCLHRPKDAELVALAHAARTAWADMPELVDFIERTGRLLHDLVAGRGNPLEILFPAGSHSVAESIYRDSPYARFYNSTIAAVVRALMQERQARGQTGLAVLEIGAGTGSTSAEVLPLLGADARYDFTDISDAFLAHAKSRFAAHAFVDYKTLDIDKPLEEQGFAQRQYDVVIASNVLHAVSDLPAALQRAHALLAPGGMLILWELTASNPWFDLTFGLLIGDLARQDPRGYQPLQPTAAWHGLLSDAGFAQMMALPQEADVARHTQHVVLAVRQAEADLPAQTLPQTSSPRRHPLLTRPVALPEQCAFDAVFDDACFGDHRLQGRPVVPAAAVLEAAAGGIQVMSGIKHVCFHDVRFSRLIAVGGREAPSLKLVLDGPSHGGRFRLMRHGVGSDAAVPMWTEYAAGKWSDGGGAFEASGSGSPSGTLLHATSQCTTAVEPAALYARFQANGLEYGRAFRGIRRLLTGVDQALAEVVLDEREMPQAQAYGCHPALMDACFQVVGAAVVRISDADEPLVPVFIESCTLRASGLNRCHVHVRLRGEPRAASAGLEADIDLFDHAGNRVGEIRGFKVMPLGQAALSEAAAQVRYQLRWQPESEPNARMLSGDAGPVAGHRWLVVCDDLDMLQMLSRPLLAAKGVVRGVRHIAEAAQSDDQYDHVLYADAAGSAQACATAFVRTFNAMLDMPACQSAKLWVVSVGANDVPSAPCAVDPVQACLWAMGRVVASEHPSAFGGLIDLPSGASSEAESDMARALAFMASQPGEFGVALRDGRIHVPRLQALAAAVDASPALSVRVDATYLITGGLGGVGLLMARRLAAEGARRLVLTTRRRVPPRLMWGSVDPSSELGKQIAQVIEIERLGAYVTLECCDVSDRQALQALLERLEQSHWPRVRGVIHAAMDLENRALSKLDADSIERVFKPKVDGALALRDGLPGASLDFMVFCSSAATLLASPGQAAYVAANAYLDALATSCSQAGERVHSIAWGPWAEAGWVVRHQAGDALAQAGVRLLSPDVALNALFGLPSGAPAYTIVAAMDWQAFSRTYATHGRLNFVSPLIVPSAGRGDEGESAAVLDAGLMPRAALSALGMQARVDHIAQGLLGLVARIMQLSPDALDERQPLGLQGLDSLMAVELKDAANRWLQVSIPMAMLVDNATVEGLGRYLAEQLDAQPHEDAVLVPLTPDRARLHEPFPLNDIQQAYWLGRTDAFALGGVGTHIYLEFEGQGLDIQRVQDSWNALIDRHDMLRCIVQSDGQQRILPDVGRYAFAVSDLTTVGEAQASASLDSTRAEMSHQVLDAGSWPLFDIRVSKLPQRKTRIHVSLDLMIADAASILILLTEWGVLYQGERALSAIPISFRDYLLAERELETTPRHQAAQRYWRDRVLSLPAGPALPLARNPQEIQRPRFSRLETRLEAGSWSRIKARAAQRGITPSMAICAAYAKTLARWSKVGHFTLNVTLFNRQALHETVNSLVGDFTSVNLLEVDLRGREGLAFTAQRVQKQLWQDLEHRSFSGISVLRELTRVRGSQITMPVVFTSNLEDTRHLSWLGKVVYGISQTPQVWLDHQVLEQDGQLLCSWDHVEDLFPNGLVPDMFDSFKAMLQQLAADDTQAWDDPSLPSLPPGQTELLAQVNATDWATPCALLHMPFVEQARRRPDATALVTPTVTISYAELHSAARNVAGMLMARGAQPNQLVAVAMEKGWEQTVAVLGILMAGAAYLPVDAHLPIERQSHLIEAGEARVILTQRCYRGSAWPAHADVLCIDDEVFARVANEGPSWPEPAPSDLAYVIFTSGSTGLPKGVMIDHRGAVNTVLDLNERIGLTTQDRVLALSNLNFDLSVYDIFGTLGAGGTIVVPDADLERDPAYLSRLVEKQAVTVWNSVPALFSLLVNHDAEPAQGPANTTLRIAMLSGDWIPLTLPDQAKARMPGIEVLSLGGATEASIWSIAFPVGEISPGWTSIPYGKALRNQKMCVFNEAMEPCPVWVTGHIYIGGIGVAKGYWRDEEKSAASFRIHPVSGERFYRTGDLGRVVPDGNIEFLGREDFQVKVQGYRIELGEVEAVLNQHDGVADSVVLAIGERQEAKRLVAFHTCAQAQAPERDALRSFMLQKLPDYMVPFTFVPVEAFPLTVNGKVDRKALAAQVSVADEQTLVAPRTDTEEALSMLVKQTLGLEAVGVETNFFEMGIDSLQGTTLVTAIRRSFDIDLPLRAFFEAPTIAQIAVLIEDLIIAEIDQLSEDEAMAQVDELSKPV